MEEITSQDWEAKVLQSEQPVVVDFGAVWCGPCKRLEPIFKEVAAANEDKAFFAKVDVDNARDLAAKYGVHTVPTLLFFKDGEVADRIGGLASKDRIQQTLDGVLA